MVLYTGKGGVGKTTTASATAVLAAARGLRVLVASADAAHSLGDVLEVELGPAPRLVEPGPAAAEGDPRPAGSLHAVEIDARAELERRWSAVRDYLVRIFRFQGLDDVVADELALLPGLEELTTLLAVDAWAESGDYDLVVVDCAPTDSALRLLSLPEAAHGAFRMLLRLQRMLTSVVTPVARNLVAAPLPDASVFRDAEDLLYPQLQALRERLTHPATSIRLVVTPERMVIDEALRARTDLALFGLACDAVVLNRMLPEEAAAEPYFAAWARQQGERLPEVEALFAPLPVLPAPLQDDEATGWARLHAQGQALFGDRAPEAFLGREEGLRFETLAPEDDAAFELCLPLPHSEARDLDVAKVDDRLVVRTAGRRRPIPLPRHLVALPLDSARLEGGTLRVRFGPRA